MPKNAETFIPANTAETMDKKEKGPVGTSIGERWDTLMQNEEAREGFNSWLRLGGNTTIAAAEYVPWAGEAPDWLAKGAELAGYIELTPDIKDSHKVALEALDVGSGGILPSRTVETLVQAHADYKNGHYENGINAAGYLLTGKENYLHSLQENRESLDAAANVFA